MPSHSALHELGSFAGPGLNYSSAADATSDRPSQSAAPSIAMRAMGAFSSAPAAAHCTVRRNGAGRHFFAEIAFEIR